MDTERDEIVIYGSEYSFEDKIRMAIRDYDERIHNWREKVGQQRQIRGNQSLRTWLFRQIDDIVRRRLINYSAGWFIIGLIVGAFLAPLIKKIIGWILLLICSTGWAAPTC